MTCKYHEKWKKQSDIIIFRTHCGIYIYIVYSLAFYLVMMISVYGYNKTLLMFVEKCKFFKNND